MKLKIRHKLFFTILLTSSVVAFGIFFFLQWNFDRGFLNYVNKQEMTKLDSLEERLLPYYREESGWGLVKDNHMLWIKLHIDAFAPENLKSLPMLGPPGKRNTRRPGPPGGSPDFGPRVMLLDENKKHVIGAAEDVQLADFDTRPILIDGRTVGYLGIVPLAEFSETGDLMFVEEQTTAFATITLLMVAVSILLSFPMTVHLLKPIKYLTEGTQKLIGGQFASRIPVTTGDELGRLSEHFNILALTLEENEKARQRWIADISHELRTPLAVLRGETEALLDGVRQASPDTLEPLHGEILHLERLVNDLYELSMSDIGALTYKKVLVDPLGILAGTVEISEHLFTAKGIELYSRLPEDASCSLLGDPDRLQQLFSNLLTNSLRYTDESGMLEISAVVGTDRIKIVFQDSAPGVAEDQLPLLFDRLFRTDPSRQRAGSGAGLGLAICTNIVDAHQGTIKSHHSDLGGLGITIELPLNS